MLICVQNGIWNTLTIENPKMTIFCFFAHYLIYFFYLTAEPPSYDSLFGRIRDTHKASRNFIDFLAKLLLLLLGTIGCTIACSVTGKIDDNI